MELIDGHGRRILLTTATEGRVLVGRHNQIVDDAAAALDKARHGDSERATLGDIEALLVRVLVAALKELARGLLPRRIRNSTGVGKPVNETSGTPARDGARR